MHFFIQLQKKAPCMILENTEIIIHYHNIWTNLGNLLEKRLHIPIPLRNSVDLKETFY